MNTQEIQVLYVDDERANRVVFEQSFGGEFRIKTVGSGIEALQILARERVGVLVADQRMPEMSGNDLLAKAKELYPNVIRVVITAYSDLDPILRAVNEGLVARYIIKPWDRAELQRILAWSVEAFALGQESSALHLRLMETERLVTLGSIGAAVIHDLNQPLACVTTDCERLRQLTSGVPALGRLVEKHGSEVGEPERHYLKELAEDLPDVVSEMADGCLHMGNVLNSMKKLLSPPTDGLTPAIDPLPAINYALSVCGSIAIKGNIQLLYTGPQDLPLVRIGSTEFNQTLINVIANAVQALLPRTDVFGHVTVSARTEDNMLRITVADNGPGIPEEVLKKVGTPFFSTRPEGTGLGIAQCRRLIGHEGGEFTIDTKVGEGTTISFTVPLAART